MERSERHRPARAAILGRNQRERGVARPYLGVRFECCGVYARIYRHREQSAYVGRCPRCLRALRIHIDPDGTPHRFFRAW